MPSLQQIDFISLTMTWVKENKQQASSMVDGEITDNTDLIATGLLDSFSLVNLVLFLETQSGCKIDLTDVEPSEFSTVRGLCGIVLRNNHGPHAHANS